MYSDKVNIFRSAIAFKCYSYITKGALLAPSDANMPNN